MEVFHDTAAMERHLPYAWDNAVLPATRHKWTHPP